MGSVVFLIKVGSFCYLKKMKIKDGKMPNDFEDQNWILNELCDTRIVLHSVVLTLEVLLSSPPTTQNALIAKVYRKEDVMLL